MNASGLFTQCTHCKAYFRVRAVTLRVGQGVAFCTSCHNQFNALERLQEGDPGFPILDAIPVTEPAAPRPAPPREALPATAESATQPPETTGVDSQARESPDTGDEWRWDLEVSEGEVLPRLSEPAVFGESGRSGPESEMEPGPGPDEAGPILARIPVLEIDDGFPAAAQPADAADIRGFLSPPPTPLSEEGGGEGGNAGSGVRSLPEEEGGGDGSGVPSPPGRGAGRGDRITRGGSAVSFTPGDAVLPVAVPDIGDLAVVPDAESEPVPGDRKSVV